MADVLTSQADTVLSFPIEQFKQTEDGDLLVYGKVTDGTIDADDQIVDPEWSAKALKDWLATGANLRVQHQPQRDPAGIGLQVDINRDGDQAHWLKALVVEPVAKRLVEKGVLRAFSVGIMRPKIFTHAKARGGMIGGGDLGEVSLVDRPANRNCAFSLVKADKSGQPEWVGKVEGDEAVIKKALTPTPADVAKAISNGNAKMPVPEKASVPAMFADPVANRLAAAIAEEKVIEKKSREFSAASRRQHASEGNALPDGSYPIPDKDALRRAAILARSGHGNVSGARSLIARRARELGVPNPLSSSDAVKKFASIAELDQAVAEGQLTRDDVVEMLMEDPWVPKAAGGTCPTCKGDGTIRGGSMKCPTCKGSGKAPVSKNNADAADTADTGQYDDDGDADGDDAGSHAHPLVGKQPGKRTRGKMECSECGTVVSKSASFCSGCGAEFTGKAGRKPVTPASAGRVTGSPSPSMTAAPVPGESAGIADPAPTWAASNPKKGSAILSGSGAMTTGTGGDTLGRKSTKAPYSMIRAHDAFCPAYDFGDVMAEYPSLDSVADALDAGEVKEAALKAVSAGNLDLGEQLLRVARSADELKEADPGLVADARAEMHKGFQSMYPSVKLTPGCIVPSSFRRDYVAAGHAAEGKDTGPSQSVSMPPMSPAASQFTRDYIAAGHATPSPGNKNDDGARPSPGGIGFRTATSKESAGRSLQLVHDHIMSTFPELCPLAPDNTSGAPLPQVTAKGAASMLPSKKPKKRKGGVGGARMGSGVMDSAAKQLAEIAASMASLKQELTASTTTAKKEEGASAELLRQLPAQLANVAAALTEKSAEGKAGSAEVAALSAKVNELHSLVAGAAAAEGGSSKARALKTAAAKLEKAAEALTAGHADSDIGALRSQLAELQGLVKGAAGQRNGEPTATDSAVKSLTDQVTRALADQKLDKLQEQLAQMGLKLESRVQPQGPSQADALAVAAEQMAKAAAALAKNQAEPVPERWQPPEGWAAANNGAYVNLAGKVDKLQEQLAAVVAGISNADAHKSGGSTDASAIHAMSQLAKVTEGLAEMKANTAAARQAEQAEAMRAWELQQMAVKQRKDDSKPAREARALKNAAAKLTKAAAAMAAKPPVDAVLLESKADAADMSILTGKMQELSDMVSKLGSQPDPQQAPVRGIYVNGDSEHASGGAFPVDRRSLVDETSQKTRDEKLKFLQSLANSGDPQVRNQAQAMINKMLGA